MENFQKTVRLKFMNIISPILCPLDDKSTKGPRELVNSYLKKKYRRGNNVILCR